MKRIAIVGVEGSGKTVMLAGLGELYSRPDARGCFLAPKNFATVSYVNNKIQRMRSGEWPTATAGDEMQGLDWVLKRKFQGQRPIDICEVSFLDFAGEVYRTAFGISKNDNNAALASEAASLKRYIQEADELIVLINLHDVITYGLEDPRVQESMWITNEILGYALDDANGDRAARAAIVISQADSYKATIDSCGGPSGVLRKYLPHVWNNYDWLDIFAVSAVDKTVLDDNGNIVPDPDFQPTGLSPIMDWIMNGGANQQGAAPKIKRPPASKKPTVHVPHASQAPAHSSTATFDNNITYAKRGGFFSAVSKSTNFKDRTDRQEYWLSLLGWLTFFGIGAVLTAIITSIVGEEAAILFGILFIWALVQLFALMARRLHDVGISGKLLWFLIIYPLIPFAVVIIGVIPGQEIPNEYGNPIA